MGNVLDCGINICDFQMEKDYKNFKYDTNICTIEINHEIKGIGFFCQLKKQNKSEEIQVLLTSKHVLDRNDIEQNKIIKLNLNNSQNSTEIKIDESREVYINEKFNITLIEIRIEDCINKKSFLEIDNEIDENYLNDIKMILLNYDTEIKEQNCNILHISEKDNTFEYSIIDGINPYKGTPILSQVGSETFPLSDINEIVIKTEFLYF